MALSMNANPYYPKEPCSFSVAVPSSAKTTLNDNSNIAVLVAGASGKAYSFNQIFVQSLITTVAGKLMLFIKDASANYRMLDEQILAAGTISTTANPVGKIIFPQWTKDYPLILPESHDLVIGVSTAQTAGALIAHAQGGRLY